jgi:hypothetical protein
MDLSSLPPTVIDLAKSYTATLRTARGEVTLKLNPGAAPVTVNNFVHLAGNRFYDGLTFHRVVPGFVAQGGDPVGDGTGGPGYKLPDETNPAPWVRGSLGMASSPAGQRVAVLRPARRRSAPGGRGQVQPFRQGVVRPGRDRADTAG